MPDNIIQPPIPTTPVTPAVMDALRAIVGDRGLIADERDKEPFVTDWRRSRIGTASVVVRPASVEETSKVVKLCYDHGIAIVPQAGNTGLMGGATPWPTHQGILLSVGRMNKVLEVDPVGYSMTVEAGCVLQTLQETAAAHDRFFPLSLGAQGSCMIGGNLSTNAGGVQDPLKADTPWYLLMQWSSSRPKTEGAEGMSEKMEQFLGEQMEKGRVLDAVLAQSEAQALNMWKIREGVAEAGRADGPGLSYDISVSISKIPEFIDKGIKAALEILPSLRPHPLGHIGDGNVHFGFGAPKGMDRPTLQQYAPAITRAVNDLITAMAGSISAEHGIGIEKLDELAHYRSRTELDTMRTIKRALDPKNIMNPGKVLRI